MGCSSDRDSDLGSGTSDIGSGTSAASDDADAVQTIDLRAGFHDRTALEDNLEVVECDGDDAAVLAAVVPPTILHRVSSSLVNVFKKKRSGAGWAAIRGAA